MIYTWCVRKGPAAASVSLERLDGQMWVYVRRNAKWKFRMSLSFSKTWSI